MRYLCTLNRKPSFGRNGPSTRYKYRASLPIPGINACQRSPVLLESGSSSKSAYGSLSSAFRNNSRNTAVPFRENTEKFTPPAMQVAPRGRGFPGKQVRFSIQYQKYSTMTDFMLEWKLR